MTIQTTIWARWAAPWLILLAVLIFPETPDAAGVAPAVNSALGCTNSGDTWQWNGSAMVCIPSGGSSDTPVDPSSACSGSRALAFPALGSYAYNITLTTNCTSTLTGGTVGHAVSVILVINAGSGGFSFTPPSGVIWPGGAPPVNSTVAGQVTTLTISTFDGGTTKIGGYTITGNY